MYLVLFFVSTAISQMLTYLLSGYSNWLQGLINAALATTVYLIWDAVIHHTAWASNWAHQQIPAHITRAAEISIAELRKPRPTRQVVVGEWETPTPTAATVPAAAAAVATTKKKKTSNKKDVVLPIATIYSHASPAAPRLLSSLPGDYLLQSN